MNPRAVSPQPLVRPPHDNGRDIKVKMRTQQGIGANRALRRVFCSCPGLGQRNKDKQSYSAAHEWSKLRDILRTCCLTLPLAMLTSLLALLSAESCSSLACCTFLSLASKHCQVRPCCFTQTAKSSMSTCCSAWRGSRSCTSADIYIYLI